MSVSILSNRTVDFLDDINAKYATLECEIEQKLASICSDEKKFEKTYSIKRVTFEDKSNKSCTDLESAKRRNSDLIKELEISKARLRSRATYSPLEQVLKKAIDNYENNSHLPQSTIRRKFGPTKRTIRLNKRTKVFPLTFSDPYKNQQRQDEFIQSIRRTENLNCKHTFMIESDGKGPERPCPSCRTVFPREKNHRHRIHQNGQIHETTRVFATQNETR